MRFYFAPMEGITLYPLRNIHREIFGEGVDKYFTPFVTAAHNHHFKNREKKDVLPERNISFDDYPTQLVPQIMAGCAEDFLWAAKEMRKLGYREVNLNLGCPAPTVVSRKKGSGLLHDTEYLDGMLKEIYSAIEDDRVSGAEERIYPDLSLKTRLGFSDDAEADRLMEIYARYPVKELTIHARVREDYYAGAPRLDAYKRAVKIYRESGGNADICYNGNIDSKEALCMLMEELDMKTDPKDVLLESQSENEDKGKRGTSSIMIGRGLLSNPALVRELRGGKGLLASELKTYLNKLYEGYAAYIPEDRNVIFKMLEHWAFLHVHFKDSDKSLKNIRKSRSRDEYHAAVNEMFTHFDH